MRFELKNYPLVILDPAIHADNHSGRFSQGLIKTLEEESLSVIIAESDSDCFATIAYSTNLSGIILAWDGFVHGNQEFAMYLTKIKAINALLPIFIMTQSHELDDVSVGILKKEVNFFWKYGDTYDFVVGRIKHISQDYLMSLLPPFFKQLVNYTEEHKSAWHTPGHMGGVAFLKSPVGRLFYDFYGENLFRSDLSISVPELGSLMAHSGVNGEAERFAATIFGADHSFFVTNGTSTSNKIVFMSCVGKGDVAIVDRNCHKSLQQAMTMADAIPIYFKPSRNAYGIIGTIPLKEFSTEVIAQKILDCPLIQDKSAAPSIAIITNSTYDGLIYNVNVIKDELAKSQILNLHFDEAWYPYAHFHPIYTGRHAMSAYQTNFHPTVFSTQSTHKLLAAFSQASMIHVKNGLQPLNMDVFNETIMMHSSTSPQYSIVASLDISSKMMEGPLGYRIISESIALAIEFRQEFYKIKTDFNANQDWFFDLWQPSGISDINKLATHHFMEIPQEDAALWVLNPEDTWHGFSDLTPNFTMLDPIKVTVLTPGINPDTTFQETGIPGPIVARYLIRDGAVDEKTSFYSILFLFSIGVNKSNSLNLLSALLLFKEAYDKNTPVSEVFPDLMTEHASHYHEMGLYELCQKMHHFLKKEDASRLLMNAFDTLPLQVLTPNAAYQHIIKQNGTTYPIEQLEDKVVLSMIAPYPPGIPVLMPGEKISADTRIIIDYLCMLERFDNAFPGFENEVHGVEVKMVHGKRKYFVNCL